MIPGASVPRASVGFSMMETGLYLLVFGVVTTQPVENRLARPIGNPPSSRRACLARWSQVIHRYPPLVRKSAGEPVNSRAACPVPPHRVNEWAVDFSYAH